MQFFKKLKQWYRDDDVSERRYRLSITEMLLCQKLDTDLRIHRNDMHCMPFFLPVFVCRLQNMCTFWFEPYVSLEAIGGRWWFPNDASLVKGKPSWRPRRAAHKHTRAHARTHDIIVASSRDGREREREKFSVSISLSLSFSAGSQFTVVRKTV